MGYIFTTVEHIFGLHVSTLVLMTLLPLMFDHSHVTGSVTALKGSSRHRSLYVGRWVHLLDLEGVAGPLAELPGTR